MNAGYNHPHKAEMNPTDDLDRMRKEYARREIDESSGRLYSYFYPPYLFARQQLTRHVVSLLGQHGMSVTSNRKVLEIGCGGGRVLLDYLSLGFEAWAIFGIDILLRRLAGARQRLPLSGISCADGQSLPFPAGQFHLALQFTAFSSVLDDSVKNHMAAEMLRILKPDGAILWYDFWLNPTNPQTRAIRPSEIRALFPDCSFTFRKVTLAPPIARRVVPLSWTIAQLLESIKLFNSHYLVLIRKNSL